LVLSTTYFEDVVVTLNNKKKKKRKKSKGKTLCISERILHALGIVKAL
jgi:hypothetical protein